MTDKLNPNYGDGAQGGMYDKDPGKNRKWSKPQTYVGAYSQDKAVGPIVDASTCRRQAPRAMTLYSMGRWLITNRSRERFGNGRFRLGPAAVVESIERSHNSNNNERLVSKYADFQCGDVPDKALHKWPAGFCRGGQLAHGDC